MATQQYILHSHNLYRKEQLKDSRLIQNRGTVMVQSRTGQIVVTFKARYCHEQMHLNTKAISLVVSRLWA